MTVVTLSKGSRGTHRSHPTTALLSAPRLPWPLCATPLPGFCALTARLGAPSKRRTFLSASPHQVSTPPGKGSSWTRLEVDLKDTRKFTRNSIYVLRLHLSQDFPRRRRQRQQSRSPLTLTRGHPQLQAWETLAPPREGGRVLHGGARRHSTPGVRIPEDTGGRLAPSQSACHAPSRQWLLVHLPARPQGLLRTEIQDTLNSSHPPEGTVN